MGFIYIFIFVDVVLSWLIQYVWQRVYAFVCLYGVCVECLCSCSRLLDYCFVLSWECFIMSRFCKIIHQHSLHYLHYIKKSSVQFQ